MNTKKMADLSVRIINAYHRNECASLTHYLAPNVIWYGPGLDHFISGKENLIRVWGSNERPSPVLINEPEVRSVALGSHACDVIMTFKAAMQFESGEEDPLFRRVQFSWAETGSISIPQIVLIHSTNPYFSPDDRRIFPERYDASTGLDKSDTPNAPVLFIGTDKAVHLIPDRNIIWIETTVSGRKCLVHSVQGNYEVLGSISQIHQKYPNLFFRTHISYLVNPYFIKELRRFTLKLADGTDLPVPEKKYTALKQQLLDFF